MDKSDICSKSRFLTSPLIFHGPSAYEQALDKAQTTGRLICHPMGLSGLKKNEAREIVHLVALPPVGDALGVVVIGPMDLATIGSSDVLLKSLEDGRDENVVMILWANDLGEVRPTVQSRCLPVWCAGDKFVDDDLVDIAESVFQVLLEKDIFNLTLLISQVKSKESEFLRVFLDTLAEEIENNVNTASLDYLNLWSSVRPLCGFKKITQIQLITPFVEECLR